MYIKHSKNLKELSAAIKNTEKAIKQALKMENGIEAKMHTNIHSFLIGAWMEVSFYKLIHEAQFTQEDRDLILLNASSLEQKWKHVLNWAFAKAFGIHINKRNFSSLDIKSKLKRTNQIRYEDILNFINQDINEIILIRNKIAHGQWYYTFNTNVDSPEVKGQQLIHSNNYFRSKERLEKAKLIIEMIIKISTSPRTFERDFDTVYAKIEALPQKYSKESYEKNVEVMVMKFKRAEEWKQRNR